MFPLVSQKDEEESEKNHKAQERRILKQLTKTDLWLMYSLFLVYKRSSLTYSGFDKKKTTTKKKKTILTDLLYVYVYYVNGIVRPLCIFGPWRPNCTNKQQSFVCKLCLK